MATALQVILTEDSQAGKAGELRKVRLGYARNFLLPRKLAVVADSYNMQAYQERVQKIEADAEEKRQKSNQAKETLGEQSSITISSKAGESGKLFGAITKDDITQELNKEFKLELTKSNVMLSRPIKSTGEYNVTVDFGSNVK
ncbi:MAG: 50S ribosomal protein L9, partial [Candidatus Caenarcaniphilales bacterium]|nr:50S ribosomal protein L9 [Candidatus Caenarcaniphilales bacterium]